VSDMPDMNNLLAQAMAMQQKLVEAQEAAAARTVEGVSGGGVVRVEVSGTMEFLRFHIDPKVVDASDVSMLEDLLLAAVHDAASKVAELNQEAMGGMGLDGISGLLG
jgi:nucleoid-associated protein EbfC